MKEIEKPPFDKDKIRNEFLFVANKLEISVKELESYLKLPKRSHHEFRNQEFLYKLGNKVFNLLNIEN